MRIRQQLLCMAVPIRVLGLDGSIDAVWLVSCRPGWVLVLLHCSGWAEPCIIDGVAEVVSTAVLRARTALTPLAARRRIWLGRDVSHWGLLWEGAAGEVLGRACLGRLRVRRGSAEAGAAAVP